MNAARRHPAATLTLIAAAIVALTAVTLNVPGSVPPAGTIVHVGGSRPTYDVADLVARADAVAIIEPIKGVHVHWNSVDNRPWAEDAMGVKSHILRDQTVKVVRGLFGPLPDEQFLLRGFGGTVDDVTLVYEEEPDLEAGQIYLAFLRRGELRFREGSEESWVLLAQGHGLFTTRDGQRWSNIVGLTVDQEYLDTISIP
ncbi:MAG TPA: hypothetical protein VM305_03985 [Candidatus Limnocylindrales bacterium]|nr:hypothetical protein [Candidatus Limnocylindrales bacterium]